MFSGVQHTGVIYFFKTTQTFDLLYFDFYSSCLSRYGVMSLYSEYLTLQKMHLILILLLF